MLMWGIDMRELAAQLAQPKGPKSTASLEKLCEITGKMVEMFHDPPYLVTQMLEFGDLKADAILLHNTSCFERDVWKLTNRMIKASNQLLDSTWPSST